jgi:hypothetical protein
MFIVRRFLLQSALIFFYLHIPAMTLVSFPASGLPRIPTNSSTNVESFASLIYLPLCLTREAILIQYQ